LTVFVYVRFGKRVRKLLDLRSLGEDGILARLLQSDSSTAPSPGWQ